MVPEPSKSVLIAFCGKGGSGKTALTALMTKHIVQQGLNRTLVIDADPTMNLPITFGIETINTVSDIREKIIQEARSAGRAEKQRLARSLDYMLFEALTEIKGFSLLVMGRPTSSGCYCPVNELLRDGIKSLARHFDMILIDGEAGVEQISRKVMEEVDIVVIISDVSFRGFQTASLIKKVIESHRIIGYKKLGLVINRVRNIEPSFQGQIDRTGLELLGYIPEDETIARFDVEAKPLLELPNDSPAFIAAGQILSLLDPYGP